MLVLVPVEFVRHKLFVIILTCVLHVAFEEGRIRLVAGPAESEGRVEVFKSNEWGGVCDIDWDLADAGVVCAQLGYDLALTAETKSFHGKINVTHYGAARCSGDENELTNCTFDAIDTDCSRDTIAGVKCGCKYIAYRIVNWELIVLF